MSQTYYGDYLGLGPLLDAQHPRSEAAGRPAHDEMLFIITHQAYELWFKQILHELASVQQIFLPAYVEDTALGTAVARLERIISILQLLISQIGVLETMQPLDFLAFRDLLVPASGFQSFQFRMIENRLGLKDAHRLQYHQRHYAQSLSPAHQELVKQSESAPTLLEVVDRWLARTPFLKFGDFDFWQSYRQAVQDMFLQERAMIAASDLLSESEKQTRIQRIATTETEFEALFDPAVHQELSDQGKRRFSYTALQGALLIQLYRELPMLQMPARLLNALASIDEMLTTWRYRHAQMVQHMIGSKQGTGGSTGFDYLMRTLDAHRVFADLNQLTTFLIPRAALPALPESVTQQLGFAWGGPA
ncbi:MAG: tryptophan 2,3-dioxygenase family protein [Candidatus Sericytochromatia bacterium]